MAGKWLLAFLVMLLASVSGCGYSWLGSNNPWNAKGVQSVYIQTLRNDTLKAGVEVPFTSALVKEFAKGGRFKIVSNELDADAVVSGSVATASSAVGGSTTVPAITKDKVALATLEDYVIATDYTASASIIVNLTRKVDGKVLWSQTLNRSKSYPGNNRYGLQGTTSVLINSSQEQFALIEIARFLASDAYENMLEAF